MAQKPPKKVSFLLFLHLIMYPQSQRLEIQPFLYFVQKYICFFWGKVQNFAPHTLYFLFQSTGRSSAGKGTSPKTSKGGKSYLFSVYCFIIVFLFLFYIRVILVFYYYCFIVFFNGQWVVLYVCATFGTLQGTSFHHFCKFFTKKTPNMEALSVFLFMFLPKSVSNLIHFFAVFTVQQASYLGEMQSVKYFFFVPPRRLV